jgi:hypothetical protein
MPPTKSSRCQATVAKTEPWQLALHCLIEAAEDREPVLHARIAVVRALKQSSDTPVWKLEAALYCEPCCTGCAAN